MMKEWGMILPTNRALIWAKESEYYSVHLYQKSKAPITITRPEKESVMYLCHSRQILNLKKKSIITTHQQHIRETQMSAGVIFKSLSVNMVSSSHLEDDEKDIIDLKN